MAPCATGTGSPWAGFFDPEPSMLVLVYLNFRQPSRWELGSALPGFLGTGSQCPGLRPRPRMSQPCFPQAGPRKPRQTHHAAGSTSNHLSRAAPPGLCPFSRELGAALPPGAPGHNCPVAGFGHTAEPLDMRAPPPSPLGLPCAPSRERLQVTHLPGTSQGPWAAGQEHSGHPAQKERREAPGLGGPGDARGHPGAKWETWVNPHLPLMKEPQERLWKRPDSSFHVSSLAPASSPGALFYSVTRPPHYLIKLSEPQICARHIALSFSRSFLSRFNKP